MSTEMYQGQDIRLTVISSLQEELYRQLEGEKGWAVEMNPLTGDVFAMVSTPSYDSNDFAFGYTENAWKRIQEDSNQPLVNRIQNIWNPGSAFLPFAEALK